MSASSRSSCSRLITSLAALATAAAALGMDGCEHGGRRVAADRRAAATAVGWPGYNGSYDGQRFAALTQIDTRNVGRLGRVCELRLGEEGPFQTGPVVIGDTMFVTTAHTTVAMNAATCAVHWRHVDSTAQQDPISVNRGAAYLDGRLFRGMPGARLAALDARSGKVVWDVKVGDPSVGEFVSSAPVAWRGTVFVGLAGGDWGVRGRVMGYDAATGRELWRFYTIPMGSEPGAETWHVPQTAKRGGGGMWTSYTLDTLTGDLYVPVGNPAPDFAPHARPGDNLFTNSVVVLDATSGRLKWWFQATPRDGFDWDVGAAPMLYTTRTGEPRVVVGSKDGHVYGLDRRTHGLAFRTPVTTISNADKFPTRAGVRTCPGALGGVEWNGPAFDPGSRTIYVGSVDWCATYKLGEVEYKPGDLYMGTAQVPSTEPAAGWVTALDGATGAVRWKVRAPSPVVAGVTPTAGGLLLTGDLGGNFYAFDKTNGKVLLTAKAGGAIAGGVVTYTVNGKQYVATTSGNISRATFKTTGSPTIVVMAVDVPQGSPRRFALAEVSAQGTTAAGAGASALAGRGGQVYTQFCTGCHGTRGEGVNGPSLTSASARRDLPAIVAFVKNPKPPMPKLYPSPLSDADVRAVAAYVRTLQGAPQR
jgi:alcohol dehydrogenase (cytochrome c)